MVVAPRDRKVFQCKVKLHGRWVRVSTGTAHRPLAEAYDATLQALVLSGLTDVVEAVVTRRVPLTVVHEEVTVRGVVGLRDRLATRATAQEVRGLVAEWVAECTRRGTPSPVTVAAYKVCLDRLCTGRGSLVTHDLTVGYINTHLSRVPNARKAYSALRVFLRWCLRRGVPLPVGVLDAMQPPPVPKARDRWLPEARVRELLLATPHPYRDALALAYGAGAEASVVCGLEVGDVDLTRRTVYLRGTKTKHRARHVRVADYLWPHVEHAVSQAREAGRTRLFLTDRWTLSDAHRRAAQAIGEPGLRLHDARHTFAVRLAKAGVPLSIIAEQLGHGDMTQVSRVYAKYRPNLEELDRWERVASQQVG